MVSRAIVRTGPVVRLCLILVLGTACQSKFQKTLLVPADLGVSAVFVYPFAFRWQEPAYRSFELSQRLVAVAIRRRGDAAMVFGPSEFKVYRLDDANPWAASNAIALLPPLRIRPERAIVLRPSAERRVLASEKELVNPAGKKAGATRSREVTYLGRVELLHPSSHQVIAEVSGQAAADPFAQIADEADPTAELTQLMEALTAEALDLIENHFSPPAPSKRWPWVVAFNPQQALSPADEGRSPLGHLCPARRRPATWRPDQRDRRSARAASSVAARSVSGVPRPGSRAKSQRRFRGARAGQAGIMTETAARGFGGKTSEPKAARESPAAPARRRPPWTKRWRACDCSTTIEAR